MTKATFKRNNLIGSLLTVLEGVSITTMAGSMVTGREEERDRETHREIDR